MLPAVHGFPLIDSNMTDQRTGEIIQKPDAIIDKTMGDIGLVSCVLIPDAGQKKGITFCRKTAKSFIDIAICNIFTIWKKLNPNDPKDHLKFRTSLVLF